MTEKATYPMPQHGWTCFHCGETFKTPGSARLHFGADPWAQPACRIKVGAEMGLLMALRAAEDELAHFRNEDQALARELYRVQSAISEKLRDAEQLGYDRGLGDAAGLTRERDEARARADNYKEAVERLPLFDWSACEPRAIRAIGALRILLDNDRALLSNGVL